MIADEELHRHAAENLAQADALVFGRVIYEMMEAAWRPAAQTGARPDWMADWMEPFARTIDAAKKYVVSSTLTQVDWNAELVRGDDLETAVRRLKQQPGKGLFVGGVKLPLALAELGLIDEYEFIVHPRLAGHGPTLFAGLSKFVDLKLVGQLPFRWGRCRCGMSQGSIPGSRWQASGAALVAWPPRHFGLPRALFPADAFVRSRVAQIGPLAPSLAHNSYELMGVFIPE
jgi:dihydrofolate reductase